MDSLKLSWQNIPNGGEVDISNLLQKGWGFLKESKVYPGVVLRVSRRMFFEFINNISYKNMKPGNVYGGSYYQVNSGYEIFTFNGYTDVEGKTDVIFTDIRQIFKKHGVSSLKGLEELEIQSKGKINFGMNCTIRNFDDTEMTGSYFYIFEGRWCRGSGAEKLSFWEVEEVTFPVSDVEKLLLQERMVVLRRIVEDAVHDAREESIIDHDTYYKINVHPREDDSKFVENTIKELEAGITGRVEDVYSIAVQIKQYVKDKLLKLYPPKTITGGFFDTEKSKSIELLEGTLLDDYDTIVFDLDGTVWDVMSPEGNSMGAYMTVHPYHLQSPDIVSDVNGNIIQLQKGISNLLDILDINNKNLGIMSRGENVDLPFEAQPSTQILKKFDLYKYFSYSIIYKSNGDKSKYVRPRGKTLFIDDDKDNIDNVLHNNNVDTLWRKSFADWLDLLSMKSIAKKSSGELVDSTSDFSDRMEDRNFSNPIEHSPLEFEKKRDWLQTKDDDPYEERNDSTSLSSLILKNIKIKE